MNSSSGNSFFLWLESNLKDKKVKHNSGIPRHSLCICYLAKLESSYKLQFENEDCSPNRSLLKALILPLKCITLLKTIR